MVKRVDAKKEKTSLTRRGFVKGLAISTIPAGYQRFIEDDSDNWKDKHRLRYKAAEVIDEEDIFPYTEYRVSMDEFIGTVEMGIEETVKNLQEIGYSYQEFSALKKHPKTGEYDHGSFRLLDAEGDKQWHVHLWENEEDSETQIYSHYEYKPEPWNISKGALYEEDRTAEHILPESDNYIQGQHSHEIKDFILENGIYALEEDENQDKVGSVKLEDPESDLSEVFYLT